MSADLRELMARYCDGDESAFHTLYAELSPRLFHYDSTTPSRSSAAALSPRTFGNGRF
jgi:hypothetical protein